MHSLEAELRELSAGGALEKAAAAGAIALERRTVFSLFEELRAALYAAVALVITGVGILVKEHLDRIGPLTLILALALAAVACYVPAIRTRSRGTARSTAADYLLLLGALFVSADLGYVESQFHWLGANWSRHLLILTALHAYTAYVLDSRLVLSVALATLAGWFGIERGPGTLTAWHYATPGLGVRALLCAGVMLVWRAIDQRMNAARFRDLFEHFAVVGPQRSTARLEALLNKVENQPWTPERLQEARAVEMLEFIATDEARALLRAWAEASPPAQAALKRLEAAAQ